MKIKFTSKKTLHERKFIASKNNNNKIAQKKIVKKNFR